MTSYLTRLSASPVISLKRVAALNSRLRAWRKVRRGGVDAISIQKFERRLQENLCAALIEWNFEQVIAKPFAASFSGLNILGQTI